MLFVSKLGVAIAYDGDDLRIHNSGIEFTIGMSPRKLRKFAKSLITPRELKCGSFVITTQKNVNEPGANQPFDIVLFRNKRFDDIVLKLAAREFERLYSVIMANLSRDA